MLVVDLQPMRIQESGADPAAADYAASANPSQFVTDVEGSGPGTYDKITQSRLAY